MKIYNIFVIILWLIIIIAYCCFLIKLRKDIRRQNEIRKEKENKNV